MNTSSFPAGRRKIVFLSALFGVWRFMKNATSLGVFSIFIAAFSFWRHSVGGLQEVLDSLILFGVILLTVCLVVFAVSLFSLRTQKKYLRFKLRRYRMYKQVFKRPEQQEKIDERIDYFYQHLRVLDEKIQEQVYLGIGA